MLKTNAKDAYQHRFWHEVTSTSVSLSVTVPWDMAAEEMACVPAHMAF
jgi:hypothetical protein